VGVYKKPSVLAKIGIEPDERYFHRLGELLAAAGTIASPTDLTKATLVDAVHDFQKQAGLFVDGDPGRETLWQLNAAWVAKAPRLPQTKAPADKAPGSGGYDSMTLRQDAAAAFAALRTELNGLGGLVTSAGGIRPLSATVSSGRSATSLHYTGLAFDMATDGGSGYAHPATDAFVVVAPTWGTGQRWRVYARAGKGQQMTLSGRSFNRTKTVDPVTSVTGKFVDFTALAAKYGFNPIGPRATFFLAGKRDYMSAEWWHFQYGTALVKGISQFGGELLRLYSQDKLTQGAPSLWENRKVIFGLDWN
jgi:hypothetical protein